MPYVVHDTASTIAGIFGSAPQARRIAASLGHPWTVLSIGAEDWEHHADPKWFLVAGKLTQAHPAHELEHRRALARERLKELENTPGLLMFSHGDPVRRTNFRARVYALARACGTDANLTQRWPALERELNIDGRTWYLKHNPTAWSGYPLASTFYRTAADDLDAAGNSTVTGVAVPDIVMDTAVNPVIWIGDSSGS